MNMIRSMHACMHARTHSCMHVCMYVCEYIYIVLWANWMHLNAKNSQTSLQGLNTYRADSRLAPSQWKTLQRNVISHLLSTILESALKYIYCILHAIEKEYLFVYNSLYFIITISMLFSIRLSYNQPTKSIFYSNQKITAYDKLYFIIWYRK